MAQHKILCLEGELKGAVIPIQLNEPIIVGRDAGQANIVFRDMTISRKHCEIELADNDTYYVTDYSSGGIVTEEETKLQERIKEKLPVGTILRIGKSGTKIKLE